MYVLNSKSLTSRFYSWIWDTDVTKFKNMCPYFWKYVATIIFLPVILPVKLLMMLAEITPIRSSKMDRVYTKIADSKTVSYFNRFCKWIASFDDFWYNIGKFLKWTLITCFAVVVAFALGMSAYLFYLKPMRFLEALGIIAITVVTLWGIIYLFTEKHLGRILWSPFKLCGNMIYNLYKNVCPMITWSK
jgi:hypothetical protein